MNGSPENPVAVLDSITHVGEQHRNRVLIAGSHGGDFCAWCATRAVLRAVILNDAGVGLEQAGIHGLTLLQQVGMPAATVGNFSARIGDGRDMMERGTISFYNAQAQALGVTTGMPAAEAASRMARAAPFLGSLPLHRESRHLLSANNGQGLRVIGLDSNSLVQPGDEGNIVVTGSHGALLGGHRASAIRQNVRVATYNDAGGGIDDAGFSRLPELDRRGIPALTVSHDSAQIGSALSSWRTGIVTRVNTMGLDLGMRTGMRLPEALSHVGPLAASKSNK